MFVGLQVQIVVTYAESLFSSPTVERLREGECEPGSPREIYRLVE